MDTLDCPPPGQYQSINSYLLIQFTVAEGLESILATTGGEAGYTQVASLTQA